MYLRATIVLWTHAKKYLQYRFTNCFLKIWKKRRHFHRPILLIYFMNIDGVFHEWRHEICGIPFFKTFLRALSCFSWLFGNFHSFCEINNVDYLYCPCGWLPVLPLWLISAYRFGAHSSAAVGISGRTDDDDWSHFVGRRDLNARTRQQRKVQQRSDPTRQQQQQ